jgi:hypothetical protein
MATNAGTPAWRVQGQYFETCSCDFLCPCIWSNLSARPTQGSCTFALVHHVETGHFGDVRLDDLNFVVVGRTPEAMGKGNWSVGLITDERASPEQQQALVTIASGQAGGPMAMLAGLIGTFLGAEAQPIQFRQDGLRRSATAGHALDQGLEAATGANPSEPIFIDNVGHPANTRLALAKATHSHVHAFGVDWDDTSGQNNGHFAPFDWQSG